MSAGQIQSVQLADTTHPWGDLLCMHADGCTILTFSLPYEGDPRAAHAQAYERAGLLDRWCTAAGGKLQRKTFEDHWDTERVFARLVFVGNVSILDRLAAEDPH